MDSAKLLSEKLHALLQGSSLPREVEAILQLAATIALEQPDLTDPLPFREKIRQVSMVFLELYGENAVPQARRVAELIGNSTLARLIVNDLEWMERDKVRQSALAEYDVVDTASEPGFDDIVMIASHVCQAPIALVSLIETHRQWFKASFGTEIKETPIEDSICIHTIKEKEVLVIPDLTLDPRTRDNPFVRGAMHIRFYAAAPLITPNGVTVGGICVIDRVPRPEGLTPMQAKILEALARQAVVQLELRRASSAASVQPAIVFGGET